MIHYLFIYFIVDDYRSFIRLLSATVASLDVSDRSEPEDIYAAVGLSKKTFKDALGLLYRRHPPVLPLHTHTHTHTHKHTHRTRAAPSRPSSSPRTDESTANDAAAAAAAAAATTAAAAADRPGGPSAQWRQARRPPPAPHALSRQDSQHTHRPAPPGGRKAPGAAESLGLHPPPPLPLFPVAAAAPMLGRRDCPRRGRRTVRRCYYVCG